MLKLKHIWKSMVVLMALAVVATSCSNGDDAVVHVQKMCTPLYLAIYDGQGNDLLVDTAVISITSDNTGEMLPVTIKEYEGRRYLYVVPIMNGKYWQQLRADGSGQTEPFIKTTIRIGDYMIPLHTYLHQLANGRVDSLKESTMPSRGYQLYGRRIVTPEKACVADMMVTRDGAFLCTQSLQPEFLAVNINFYSPMGTNVIDSLQRQQTNSYDQSWLKSLYQMNIRPYNSMPALEKTNGWSTADGHLSVCASMGDWCYHKVRGTWRESSYTFELKSEVLFGDDQMHTVELTFDRNMFDNKITGCAFDGHAYDLETVGFRESLFYGVNLEFYQK